MHGARIPFPGDNRLDTGGQERFPARERDGPQGDRHPGILLGLSHIPEAEHDQKQGDGAVYLRHKGRARFRHHPPLPFRGYHPRGLLRVRDTVRPGADEALGGSAHTHQDKGVRHHGLRRPVFRRGAAEGRAGDNVLPQALCGRPFRTPGVARA